MKLQRKAAITGIAAAAAVAALVMPARTAQAQDKVSYDVSMDLTTHYFYRGLPQENQGVIFQPAMGVGFELTDATSLSFGLWNSFHENQTGAAGSTVPIWYEADWSIGISQTLTDGVSLDLSYIALTSPSNAFATVEELDLGLSFDHELSPYILVAWELQNGADGGADEGVYLEVGAAYETALVESKTNPVTLAIPVTAGFSLGSYYEGTATSNDDSFGYLDIGADLTTPCTFIDKSFGEWDMTFGLHYIHLGTQAARFGAGITDGTRDHVYAKVGMSASF